MAVRQFGAIAFPKIPTPAQERLGLELRIRQKEGERESLAALVSLQALPQWMSVQKKLLAWAGRLMDRLAESEDVEIYRCQGEYRAIMRLVNVTVRPAESLKALDQEIAEMRQRLTELPQS